MTGAIGVSSWSSGTRKIRHQGPSFVYDSTRRIVGAIARFANYFIYGDSYRGVMKIRALFCRRMDGPINGRSYLSTSHSYRCGG